ncbi:hypothetical protein BC832DRAFT_469651 [Gaertneriomyces semiglobifer]|nr:hypothetical protein BC832DRAFT_469651 [Gaertneriomyces semiglobifer]
MLSRPVATALNPSFLPSLSTLRYLRRVVHEFGSDLHLRCKFIRHSSAAATALRHNAVPRVCDDGYNSASTRQSKPLTLRQAVERIQLIREKCQNQVSSETMEQIDAQMAATTLDVTKRMLASLKPERGRHSWRDVALVLGLLTDTGQISGGRIVLESLDSTHITNPSCRGMFVETVRLCTHLGLSDIRHLLFQRYVELYQMLALTHTELMLKEPRSKAWAVVETSAKQGDAGFALDASKALLRAGILPSSVHAVEAVLDGIATGHACSQPLLVVYWEYYQILRSAIKKLRDSRRGGCPVDNIYSAFISKFVALGGISQASSVLAEMESNGRSARIPLAYNRLIMAYVSRGNTSAAAKLYQMMRRQDYPPNTYTMNNLLNGYTNEGNISKADEILKEMEERGLIKDEVTYNIMIKMLIKKRDLAGARELLRTLLPQRQYSVARGVSSLIKAYHDIKDERSALELYELAVENDVDISTHTHNILISLLAGKGLTSAVEKLYTRMINMGRTPDHITFLSILSNGDREFDHSPWVERMRNYNIKPTGNLFNVLLNNLARQGRTEEVHQMIFEAEQSGLVLGVDSFNVLLKSLRRQGSPEKAQDVLRMMTARSLSPDIITYNTIIAICLDYGDLNSANRFFRQMSGDSVEARVEPDAWTYGMLINANARRGHLVAASRLMGVMNLRKISKDEAIFHSMLNGYARLADSKGIQKTLTEMTAAGFVPSTKTYSTILGGLIHSGDYQQARAWLEIMRTGGILFDAYTYNQKIHLLMVNGQFTLAEQTFEEFRASGWVPDSHTFNTMISGYCASGRYGEAQQWFVRMQDSGLAPEHTTYTIFIGYHVNNQNMKAAEEIFMEWYEKCTNQQCTPSPSPFAAMIYGWGVVQKNLDKSLSYWKMMVDAGVKPNSSVYTCLMQAHSHAENGSLETILHIFDRLLSRRDEYSTGVESATACVAIDACGMFNRLDALRDVWTRLRRKEAELDIPKRDWTNIYTSYIEALIRCGELADAVQVLIRDVPRAQVKPDAKMFSTCLRMLAARDRTGQLVSHVRRLLEDYPALAEEVAETPATGESTA